MAYREIMEPFSRDEAEKIKEESMQFLWAHVNDDDKLISITTLKRLYTERNEDGELETLLEVEVHTKKETKLMIFKKLK